jgi:hypothetical protein
LTMDGNSTLKVGTHEAFANRYVHLIRIYQLVSGSIMYNIQFRIYNNLSTAMNATAVTTWLDKLYASTGFSNISGWFKTTGRPSLAFLVATINKGTADGVFVIQSYSMDTGVQTPYTDTLSTATVEDVIVDLGTVIST